jgi:DNA modification methylase
MQLDIIYNENCITGLKQLPDCCIDCCITSPPYFGLRDYHTGTWEGGDPDCNHEIPKGEHDPKRVGGDSGSSHVSRFIRDKCYKCGAIRVDQQIGLEKTPEEYVAKLVGVFGEVKRVLRDDGTCWINMGDSYYTSPPGNTGKTKDIDGVYNRRMERQLGHGEDKNAIWKKIDNLKPKNLLGMPWRLAFALQSDGWILRQDIIWAKGNPMPESVKDRCTKSHEYIFLLAKKQRYYFDNEAIKEPVSEVSIKRAEYGWHGKGDHGQGNYAGLGQIDKMGTRFCNPDSGKNKRDVWIVNTQSYKEAHFATFPEKLIEPCVLAGCPKGGVILDPFMGSGTTANVAVKFNRHYIGFELNMEYIKLSNKRLAKVQMKFAE